MKHIAIVLAAGSGKRMGTDCPKQFLEINEKPLIYYCLKRFEESFVDEIIVVTRQSDIEYVKTDIVDYFGFGKVSKVIEGGKERYDSVYNGLCAVDDTDSYIYVHDGARAFVSADILERVKNCVEKNDACVVCVPSKDTVKVSDERMNVSATPRRSSLWCAQTPQAFRYEILKDSFTKMYGDEAVNKEITDDASIVEKYSDIPVKIVEGSYTNIKITTPEDLFFAKLILDQKWSEK